MDRLKASLSRKSADGGEKVCGEGLLSVESSTFLEPV